MLSILYIRYIHRNENLLRAFLVPELDDVSGERMRFAVPDVEEGALPFIHTVRNTLLIQ